MRDYDSEIKIIEIVNTRITSLHPKDSIQKAQLLFDRMEKNIIPVLVGNEFRGVLIRQDFKALEKANKFIVKVKQQMVDVSQMTVEDFYKHDVRVLDVNAKLFDALEFFIANRQYYIPILKDNAFIGLVTPFDVFKYLVKLENDKM